MNAARLPAAMLDDAFDLARHAYIFLIGGGGKTTLMFMLARHLADGGRTVVATTSTKILYPSAGEAARVIVEEDAGRAAARLGTELSVARQVVLGKALCEGERKLSGYSTDELDDLRRARVVDYVIVEADGAAGRSLKAHEDYEPVISARAELVIAVIGADCVGCPLDDAHVHRAARVGQLLKRPMGTPITAEDVAAIFFHPLGYLKAVPAKAEVIILISKAGGTRRAVAEALAATLRGADRRGRIARIVIGELVGPAPFVEPVG